MSIFKTFATDKKLEAEDGVTIELENGESVTLHRAGGANKKYATLLQSKMKPVRFQVQHGTLPQETSTRLLAEVYAEAVIVGWKVRGEDGEFMEATTENIVKTLIALPDFFAYIQREAENVALFRKEEMKADAKN